MIPDNASTAQVAYITALEQSPLEAIEQLKTIPQWLGWRYERISKRDCKVPYTFTNKHFHKADYTDSRQWLSYADAVALFHRSLNWQRPLNGLCIVLHDMWANDLDRCMKYSAMPSIRNVDAWAQDFILAAHTFANPSVRGRGVHTLGLSSPTLPKGYDTGINLHIYDVGIEFYTGNKCMAIMPNHLAGTPQTLSTSLDDAYCLIEKIIRLKEQVQPHRTYHFTGERAKVITPFTTDVLDARTQAIIARLLAYPENNILWHGGQLATHGSPSEADQALLYRIAWLVGDNEAWIEHIYSQSARAKDGKWERPGYRKVSIENAIVYMLGRRGQIRDSVRPLHDVRRRDALEQAYHNHPALSALDAAVALDIVDHFTESDIGEYRRYAVWEAALRLWPDKQDEAARKAIRRAIQTLQRLGLLSTKREQSEATKRYTHLKVTRELLAGELPIVPPKNKGGRPKKC